MKSVAFTSAKRIPFPDNDWSGIFFATSDTIGRAFLAPHTFARYLNAFCIVLRLVLHR